MTRKWPIGLILWRGRICRMSAGVTVVLCFSDHDVWQQEENKSLVLVIFCCCCWTYSCAQPLLKQQLSEHITPSFLMVHRSGMSYQIWRRFFFVCQDKGLGFIFSRAQSNREWDAKRELMTTFDQGCMVLWELFFDSSAKGRQLAFTAGASQRQTNESDLLTLVIQSHDRLL